MKQFVLLPLFSLNVSDAVGHCVVTADVICRRVTGGFRVSTCKLNSKEHKAEALGRIFSCRENLFVQSKLKQLRFVDSKYLG